MKILVILERPWQIREFLARLRRTRASPDPCLVLCPTPGCQKILKRLKIPFKTEQDFDFPGLYSGVPAQAYYLTESWSEDLAHFFDASYRGIRIPSLIDRDGTYYFLWILRSICFLDALLGQFKPEQVWALAYAGGHSVFFRGGNAENVYGQIALDFAKKKGIASFDFQTPRWERLKSLWAGFWSSLAYGRTGPRLARALVRMDVRFFEFIRAAAADLLSKMSEAVLTRVAYFSNPPRKDLLRIGISSSENCVAPVIQELKERKDSLLYFIRETFSPAQMFRYLKNGSSFKALSFQSRPRTEAVRKYRSSLRENWACHSDQLLARPFYEWKGYHFGHLLKPKYEFLFRIFFPSLAQLVEDACRFLSPRPVSRILMEEDVCTFNKTLAQVAAQLKIPSLVVQHGQMGLRVGFYPLSATRFAAFGEFDKRRLVEWGVAPERIVVSGNVTHDPWLRAGIPSRKDIFESLKLDPSKKMIVLGMFPYRDYETSDFPEIENFASHYEMLLRMALESLEAFPGLQLVIKLHPRDQGVERCRAIVEKIRTSGVAIVQTAPRMPLLYYCECLVATVSTLLIDALAFKKPVILVNFSRESLERMRAMVGEGIPMVPGNSQAFIPALREILEKDKAWISDEIVGDRLYKVDGRASRRVLDALMSV